MGKIKQILFENKKKKKRKYREYRDEDRHSAELTGVRGKRTLKRSRRRLHAAHRKEK